MVCFAIYFVILKLRLIILYLYLYNIIFLLSFFVFRHTFCVFFIEFFSVFCEIYKYTKKQYILYNPQMVILMYDFDDTYEIVQKTRLKNVMKDMSSLKISEASVERVQKALNLLGEGIIETAMASAIYNQRKTVMESDVDCALEALYNYIDVFDKIFSENNEQNDNSMF